MDENFMTFPLMEEGLYFPQINLWIVSNPHVAVQETEFEVNGYYIFTEHKPRRQSVLKYNISPAWDYDDKDSYKFKKEDWSIEEMIQIAEICKDGGIDEWVSVGSLEMFSKIQDKCITKEEIKQDNPTKDYKVRYDEFGIIGVAEDGYTACLSCKYTKLTHHSMECEHCLATNGINDYYVR